MDTLLKVVIFIIVKMYAIIFWLSHRRKRIKVDIKPGEVDRKPNLVCTIDNNNAHTITISDCHLIVDGTHSSLKTWNLPLPYTFQPRYGGVFCFDATVLISQTIARGQKQFRVQGIFHDSMGQTYLTKTLSIDTHPKDVSIFENQYERHSEQVITALHLAQEVAEQLDQQLVKLPHVLLGLIHEKTGIGGYVLRELGLQDDFLLELAKTSPNLPRDYRWPHPHQSLEVQQLTGEFMSNEARKMRQKWQGTGHLLLGLTKQKNEIFLKVLKHLGLTSGMVHREVYAALRKNLNPKDHPTLPPEGIKRYIWSLWYSVAHTLYKTFWFILLRFSPNTEI